MLARGLYAGHPYVPGVVSTCITTQKILDDSVSEKLAQIM